MVPRTGRTREARPRRGRLAARAPTMDTARPPRWTREAYAISRWAAHPERQAADMTHSPAAMVSAWPASLAQLLRQDLLLCRSMCAHMTSSCMARSPCAAALCCTRSTSRPPPATANINLVVFGNGPEEHVPSNGCWLMSWDAPRNCYGTGCSWRCATPASLPGCCGITYTLQPVSLPGPPLKQNDLRPTSPSQRHRAQSRRFPFAFPSPPGRQNQSERLQPPPPAQGTFEPCSNARRTAISSTCSGH